MVTREVILILAFFGFGIFANDGSYYQCKQGTYDCSCTPTNQQTPYTNWKDCDQDCCPYWNCDSNTHQCRLDLAGGYSRVSCAESCGIEKNGYACEADVSSGTFQCPIVFSIQEMQNIHKLHSKKIKFVIMET